MAKRSVESWDGLTVAEIRAKLDAAKIVAIDNFERDWGTRDAKVVFEALRKTIPLSASPADACNKARAMIV